MAMAGWTAQALSCTIGLLSDWCFALFPLRGRAGVVAPQGAEGFSVEGVLEVRSDIKA
jgi:hypothetical protein